MPKANGTQSRIGPIAAGTDLHLIPAQNGGWIVSAKHHPGERGDLLGAYTNAQDMISALEFALVQPES